MSRHGKISSFTRASAMAWILVVGVAFAISASTGPQIAPPTPFSTQNDFLFSGHPLNGSVLVTSPAQDSTPGAAGDRSGNDPDGYIGRARRVDPDKALGDFGFEFMLTEDRHGAGTVLARGPVPMQDPNIAMRPPQDSVSYLYVVGGKGPGGVSNTIERVHIDADGTLYPGLEADTAGFLIHPRYGASVVASGDFIYVIGGYDGSDQPLDSIERFQIDVAGALMPSVGLAGPGWGGDVAAVIVNGYLYVIGGNTLPRGPDEGAIRSVGRAAIGPDGSLSAFEDLSTADALLPYTNGVAGGRAFVVAAWETVAPAYSIYYVGGNVGNTVNGATDQVIRLRVNSDNTIAGPWSTVPLGNDVVKLNDPRELFAAVVSNGYVWVIGGETTEMGSTTFYSTVERAEVHADGSIGGLTTLEYPNETYINGIERASDISGMALNNTIYVPGGRDGNGNAMRKVFFLDLDQADWRSVVLHWNVAGTLTDATTPDTSIFTAARDLGTDQELDSLWFDIEPDAAAPGGILFRFRYAADGASWSGWSGYVPVEALPTAIHGAGNTPYLGSRHLLDLSYGPGLETGCSAGVVANPTAFQGPLTARYLQYEVVMPAGGKDQRFDGLTINAHPLAHFALPGGYDPRYAGQTHPPSCSPASAIADAGASGWVRFTGAGFPMADYNGWLALVPTTPNAPVIVIHEIDQPDTSTIDMRIEIASKQGGSWNYDLRLDVDGNEQFAENETLLSPALRVYSTPHLVAPPAHGLDIVSPGNATINDNVVQAPAVSAGKATFAVAVMGGDLRSGRVDDSGPIAVADPNAANHWPGNPLASTDDQPFYLRYKVDDLTPDNGGQFVDLQVAGTPAGTWRNVGPGEMKSSGRFDIALEIDPSVKSGAHELEITIQSPQLGVTTKVTQTIHVVPDLRVDTFKTRNDPAPDPNPGVGNNYDWTDAYNPAMADLGDGIGTPDLAIVVSGAGFKSDSGSPLIRAVASMTPQYGPVAGAFDPNVRVTDRNTFDFIATVPQNTMPGRHDFSFTWIYDPGISDPYDPGTQVAPLADTSVVLQRTWQADASSWKTLYVAPPRIGVQSILGSSNTQNPIILLQSDPTLTVNGTGFATGGPSVGFGCVLNSARLISMANSPDEDLMVPVAGVHMVSDCQARLTPEITADVRAGEIYMLEMTSKLELPPSSKVRDPYSLTTSSEMVTVLPLPRCDGVTAPGQFFAVDQGLGMSQVTVRGMNFDLGSTPDLGPGVTVENLVVTQHTQPNTQDTLTFDLMVDPLAAPGRRSVQIENGPTAALSQRASCSANYDFWVVPVPAISSVQPGTILAPAASLGTSRVPIDVYGTNFVTGATVDVLSATGVTVAGPVVVVNGGHLTTELDVSHSLVDRGYTLQVSEPAGPAGMPDKLATGAFQVTGFREIGVTNVASQQQCQGRSGTMQVTGTNFEYPPGTDLVADVSLGPDVSIDALDIASATSLTFSYSVGEGAALGNRPLRLDPVLPGGTPAIWSNALRITSSPSVTTVSPSAVPTGGSKQVTISGRNFYPGGVSVTVTPSANLTVGPVTIVNTGVIQVMITADAQASPEPRTITVTNADGGQCNEATLTSSFQVIPQMSIAGVTNETSQCQGLSGTLSVTGLNFKDPSGTPLVGSASLGNDVLIDAMTINNATSLTLHYVVSDSAAIGRRTLTLDPTVQGATPAVYPNALAVTSSPSITSVSPQSISPGVTRQLTISGRNFLPAASLAFSPATGMTIEDLSVVNSGLVLATVTVEPTVTQGPLVVMLDNLDGQCSLATFNAAITVVDPPHVASWRFYEGKLRINGWNFHDSIQIYIGGSTSPYNNWKFKQGHTRLLVGRPQDVFPKGVETMVRLVNPDDGGEVTFYVTR